VSKELRNGHLAILVTLIAQFLIGMGVNLFVTVPLNHPGANPSEYFSGVVQSVAWAILHGPVMLIGHAVLGLVLVAFGIRLLALAIGSRERRLIVSAAIGVVAILAAGFNGGSYLNYHEDFSSMIMAAFFAIAVMAYVFGLWSLPLPKESPRQGAR
jgi:hypothetical protein